MRELTCCGKKPMGDTVQGVIVGVCLTCGRIVARINPKTGNTEEITNDDAWSEMPRKVLMTKAEFRMRRRA